MIDNRMHIDFTSKMGCSKNFSKMDRADYRFSSLGGMDIDYLFLVSSLL